MELGEISKDNYREYLEALKIDIGDFLRYAESVSTKEDHKSIRKRSMIVRNKLKGFRRISLMTEKKLDNAIKQTKQNFIKENIE